MLAPPSDWVTLCDRIDPRITTDPHWPALAAQLDRASAKGTDVPAILRAIASEQRDFADRPTLIVTHTCGNLGHLDQPTLIVTDNRGDQGFLSLDPVKVHYGFSGFRPPLPTSGPMQANAGRAIRVKWALTAPDGVAVTAVAAVTGYAFDAPGATFTLTYDQVEQQYVLLVKTPRTWAGQTRTLTVTLNDKSVHTQVVTF